MSSATSGTSGEEQLFDENPVKDDGVDQDPRQVFLPKVDTSVDLADGQLPFKLTLPTACLLIPAVITLCVSVWGFTDDRMVFGSLLLGITMLFAGGAVLARVGSTWSMYPHERVLAAWRHVHRRVSMPWGYSAAVSNAEELHGLKHPITIEVGGGDEDDERARLNAREEKTFAGMLMASGRAVVPIRLIGSNTEFLDGELEILAGSLSQGISELGPDGGPISFYSTTRPASSQVASEYVSRARNSRWTRLTTYLAGLLGEIGEWVADRDEETGANEMYHYLVVEAASEPAGSRDQVEQLEHRIEQALTGMDTAQHLEAEPLSPHEVVNLAAEYWGRESFPEDETGESAAEAAVPPVEMEAGEEIPEREGTTAAERNLSPEWYAEKSRHVEIGDSAARTIWVSGWPEEPSAKFMQGLYGMSGVDLDMKMFGHPKYRENVLSMLKRQVPRIDAEGMEKAENMDVESLLTDSDLSAYARAFVLLQSVSVRPWAVSGYVTVRAPTVKLLEKACEHVRKEMKTPEAMTPSAPLGEQHLAFRSSGPFASDRFAGLGEARHRATKTHLALGGVFGAMMPAATPKLDDEKGIRFGRNDSTGETIQVDPFEQGTAPHLMSIGPSGSGKTVSVKEAVEEWAMLADDRTVVACDTQGEFGDFVEAFNAEHIVVDGQTGINPLEIRQAPEHQRKATDGEHNQYRLTVRGATEFFCEVVRSNGKDVGEYRSTIEQAVEQTFANAGIDDDPETHEKVSPEPVDFFETLKDMIRNPCEYSFTDEEAETKLREEEVGELLNELSGFQEGGKFHGMLSETTEGISPDVDMAYVDMRQLKGQTGGMKSANLSMAIGQVSQLIKQQDGEVIFVIDEAHNLLHSPEMVDWLNKAAREWRRYDAALWFVTQSPQEFVRRPSGSAAGAENKRKSIAEQCSTVQIFNAPNVDAKTLTELGVPMAHTDTVKKHLTAGNEGKDHSECLLSFRDERGWLRTRVEVNPFHLESITYSHQTGQSYRDWMRKALGADVDESGESDANSSGPSASDASAPSRAVADGGQDNEYTQEDF